MKSQHPSLSTYCTFHISSYTRQTEIQKNNCYYCTNIVGIIVCIYVICILEILIRCFLSPEKLANSIYSCTFIHFCIVMCICVGKCNYEDVYLLLHFQFWHFQEWHFQKCHFQIFSEMITYIWIILTLLEKILILTLSRMTLSKVYE